MTAPSLSCVTSCGGYIACFMFASTPFRLYLENAHYGGDSRVKWKMADLAVLLMRARHAECQYAVVE